MKLQKCLFLDYKPLPDLPLAQGENMMTEFVFLGEVFNLILVLAGLSFENPIDPKWLERHTSTRASHKKRFRF